MWTIEDALPVVRNLSAIAKEHGFSVALYGDVLAAGRSSEDGDLDLFFIASEDRTNALHAEICLKAIAEKYGIAVPKLSPLCTAHIELGKEKRIDAQFLDYTPLRES
jgi:hypothetical protein